MTPAIIYVFVCLFVCLLNQLDGTTVLNFIRVLCFSCVLKPTGRYIFDIFRSSFHGVVCLFVFVDIHLIKNNIEWNNLGEKKSKCRYPAVTCARVHWSNLIHLLYFTLYKYTGNRPMMFVHCVPVRLLISGWMCFFLRWNKSPRSFGAIKEVLLEAAKSSGFPANTEQWCYLSLHLHVQWELCSSNWFIRSVWKFSPAPRNIWKEAVLEESGFRL